MPELRPNLMFGMGNPLLDISAHVEESFLTKYGLEANNAILAESKHLPMFAELEALKGVEYIAGGATQNSFRVAAWILGKQSKGPVGTFVGCVGKDAYGQRLKENMAAAGVRTEYQVTESVETGTCACCINGNGANRSMVANLAAANAYTKDHLDQAELTALMKAADFYYISGFFLTVCPDAMVAVGEEALASKKTFITNLSAPFICEFFKDPMLRVLPYADIVVCNETEAETFARVHEFGTSDRKEIAKRIAAWEKKAADRPRMAIITQGPEPVLVAVGGEDAVKEFPVPQLSKEELLDTNGAGDAWVGGFLAQWVQGKSLEEAVRCANWAANLIIQRSGCTYPEICDFH